MHTLSSTYTLEDLAAVRVREALSAMQTVQNKAPSRHNSIALTHLEDALYRAESDIKEKARG